MTLKQLANEWKSGKKIRRSSWPKWAWVKANVLPSGVSIVANFTQEVGIDFGKKNSVSATLYFYKCEPKEITNLTTDGIDWELCK